MKLTAVIVMLISISMLLAVGVDQYTNTGWGVKATLTNVRNAPVVEDASFDNNDGLDTVSSITRTFALPYSSVSVRLNSISWNVFDEQGRFLYQSSGQRDNAVNVAKSFTFREMHGFTIRIDAQYSSDNKLYTLNSVDFDLVGSDPINIPASISPAFVDAYKQLADNWDYSYLRDLPIARPKMLIISHTQLANYQADFIKWKKQQGFEVYVANKSDIGTTLDQFKTFIANHYNQYHCDYLLLFGDVGDPTASFTIPTAFFPSPEYQENDADDHQYSMIEGDDYFPELLVGRFSFGTVSEFITMTNKSMGYEKAPYMTDTNWMRRALTAAGNYAEGGLRPITPVQMSRWLRNRFLDYGFTAVDTVFYPPTYPGTSLIQSSISQGVQYVSYRGWGDANGWHYPSFHLADLNSTFNGAKMPIVFSIVCNTGDFANTVNPSFGEKWMRMGTMTTPGGCVAFVGPSDLHTKTRLNNSISSGAFRSILDYGVRNFGPSVLAGKMELYKNFPNDLANDQYVSFYFHVYNLLSDPSLNMWMLVPQTIPESVIVNQAAFSQSSSSIRIEAGNLNGATVTGTKNGTDFTYTTVQNGFAILPVDPNQTGDLTVTITKPNFVPLVKVLTPATASLALVGNDMAGIIVNPNSSHVIALDLKNMTNAPMTNVQLTLTTANPDVVTINGPQQTISNLAAGATITLNYPLMINGNVLPRQKLTFTLSTTNPATTASFQLTTGGAEFMVLSHSGTMNIGSTNAIGFQMKNIGTQDLTGVVINLHPNVNAMVVTNPTQNLSNWGAGETRAFTFNIQLANDCYEGRNLPLIFTITGTPEYSINCSYALTAGTPSANDPTGPCEYGYFAYDSFDVGYAQKPTYEWIEVDPDDGGQGTVYSVQDDGSRVIDLPFTFKYYGQNYNQITVCSNGWLSFGATDMQDFYNCYIPAALGPKAMVAGYWDDLKGMKTGTDNEGNGIFNDMRICYWYDQANNRYIVEWNDAYNQYTIDLMQDASLEKFQIILYPQADRDGDIVIQYHTVDNPGTTTNYCTVGIEDHLQLDGVTYTHGNQYPLTASTLQAGLAIKFTTIPPDSYVANEDPILPAMMSLGQNYPNPFNPTTTIEFDAPKAGNAKLTISNIRGQVVRTLLDAPITAGKQTLVWNGDDDRGQSVASGLYLYRLEMSGQTRTKRMLLIK